MGYDTGGYVQCYPIITRPEVEGSNPIIICIVLGLFRFMIVLFDMGSNLSYMSIYFSSCFDTTFDPLDVIIYVYTPIEDSLLVDQVYTYLIMTFASHETMVNLHFIDMIDFYVIMGMDWLSFYHVFIDCYAMILTLALSCMTKIAWKCVLHLGPKRIISFIKDLFFV